MKRFLRFFDRNNIWFDEGKNEATSGFVSWLEQGAEYGLEDLNPGSMFQVPLIPGSGCSTFKAWPAGQPGSTFNVNLSGVSRLEANCRTVEL
ncbi:MAG: hypothetical protein IPJ06_02090 [Saprospiraceae bacterium]|nr:hypothetical protein [Saprospiraceae bacterium]